MNLSYWEYKTWLSNIDYTIVGSGIVGLNCALQLKLRFPQAKILILEKGILPQGASTKNAGFACFGSISEILSDIAHHSEQEVVQMVRQRWEGIQLLREQLGDRAIGFKQYGGHEIFTKEQENLYEDCLAKITTVNSMLEPVFGTKAFILNPNIFDFNDIKKQYITHTLEAQIHTGNMMQTLLQKAQKSGVFILNGIMVKDYIEKNGSVCVQTNVFEYESKKVLIATNGFASQWIKEDIKPARAQVLITKPIKNLLIKGTFHMEEGYYYFRNIDNRILLGGGRNLDFKTEETTDFGQTKLVQDRLEYTLRNVILPMTKVEIEQRWSGIMGVGLKKKPIVKQLSENVACGVRLGGMGIAIGSHVGKQLATVF